MDFQKSARLQFVLFEVAESFLNSGYIQQRDHVDFHVHLLQCLRTREEYLQLFEKYLSILKVCWSKIIAENYVTEPLN